MPASLKWIDYDSGAHQRAQRILRLFSEKETRDELGLGSIRDAIADSLFPGTSVIHTRLRYMLFIPWIYSELEADGVPSSQISRRARDAEIDLVEALLENCPDDPGIIGRDARKALKTLPSAIYWAGIGSWGLRFYPGTQGQYHRALDLIYDRRRRLKTRRAAALEDGDDVGGLWDIEGYTWHPGLPDLPPEFPWDASFDLTREEARFLQERIRHAHPDSLLSHLVLHPRIVECDAPWAHPDQAEFSQSHRNLLVHGHNFSLAVYGAALLYNLLLAEQLKDEKLIEQFHGEIDDWARRFKARLDDLRGWVGELDVFWATVAGVGHDIGPRTISFVEHWLDLALQHREDVFDNAAARRLIRDREIEKKKANSRFTNQRMLEQWSGRSGLVSMTFRWSIVQSYVADFAKALKVH